MDPNIIKIVYGIIAVVVAAGIALTIKIVRRTTNTSKVTANRVTQKTSTPSATSWVATRRRNKPCRSEAARAKVRCPLGAT
jgi:hypothetical protein